MRVSQGVSQALVIKKVQPEYPDEARRKHIKGNVVMQVEISPEGDVTDVALIYGDPLLAPSALAAVKQWKYKPYLLNGQPVAVQTQVTVAYTLSSR